jgi:hypothetical protein
VCLLVALGGATGQAAQAFSLQVKHKPWNKMSRHEKVVVLKKQIHIDHSVIRFWRNHKDIQSPQRHIQVHWATTSLKIASHSLHKLTYSAHRVTGSDMSAWMCIHSYEGSWTDGGSPYWGGLQMDLTFQQTYGSGFMRRWGTADHWPVWAQIAAARKARDSGRGYTPWSHTAHLCGLL